VEHDGWQYLMGKKKELGKSHEGGRESKKTNLFHSVCVTKRKQVITNISQKGTLL